MDVKQYASHYGIEVDSIFQSLKVISSVKQNEYVDTEGKEIKKDQWGYLRGLYRWVSSEGRESNVRAIGNIIKHTFLIMDLCLANFGDQRNQQLLQRALNFMDGVCSGLANLITSTYKNDDGIGGKIETIINDIADKMALIRAGPFSRYLHIDFPQGNALHYYLPQQKPVYFNPTTGTSTMPGSSLEIPRRYSSGDSNNGIMPGIVDPGTPPTHQFAHYPTDSRSPNHPSVSPRHQHHPSSNHGPNSPFYVVPPPGPAKAHALPNDRPTYAPQFQAQAPSLYQQHRHSEQSQGPPGMSSSTVEHQQKIEASKPSPTHPHRQVLREADPGIIAEGHGVQVGSSGGSVAMPYSHVAPESQSWRPIGGSSRPTASSSLSSSNSRSLHDNSSGYPNVGSSSSELLYSSERGIPSGTSLASTDRHETGGEEADDDPFGQMHISEDDQ